VAIIKKRLNLDASLYILLPIFSVILFEKIGLNKRFFATTYSSEGDMLTN